MPLTAARARERERACVLAVQREEREPRGDVVQVVDDQLAAGQGRRPGSRRRPSGTISRQCSGRDRSGSISTIRPARRLPVGLHDQAVAGEIGPEVRVDVRSRSARSARRRRGPERRLRSGPSRADAEQHVAAVLRDLGATHCARAVAAAEDLDVGPSACPARGSECGCRSAGSAARSRSRCRRPCRRHAAIEGSRGSTSGRSLRVSTSRTRSSVSSSPPRRTP